MVFIISIWNACNLFIMKMRKGVYVVICFCRSLANNSLDGSVPSTIWQNKISNGTEQLIV